MKDNQQLLNQALISISHEFVLLGLKFQTSYFNGETVSKLIDYKEATKTVLTS
jgi:hypothetical protein